MSNIKYWLALSMLKDIGPKRAKKLLSKFGSPQKVFESDYNDLVKTRGFVKNLAENIKNFSSWDLIEKHIDILNNNGIKLITYEDSSYPELLREVEDSPILIYVKGNILPQDRYAIAIVGSRKPTHYGISVAENISEELASMGFTIVSGLARGIDSLSHKAALKVGGRTVAVLGSGLDITYPPENKMLIEKIINSGYVLSEFPLGTPPDRENFPKRNRIISGLCLGVLVIEATSDSGSLITASYALDQNREVFAIPGNITSPNSSGTNELIKKGAILTRNADDIIKELAPVLKGFIKSNNKTKVKITGDEMELCKYLSGEPKQIDTISRESGLPASKLMGILLNLELKGVVKQIPGKRFYLS